MVYENVYEISITILHPLEKTKIQQFLRIGVHTYAQMDKGA